MGIWWVIEAYEMMASRMYDMKRRKEENKIQVVCGRSKRKKQMKIDNQKKILTTLFQ